MFESKHIIAELYPFVNDFCNMERKTRILKAFFKQGNGVCHQHTPFRSRKSQQSPKEKLSFGFSASFVVKQSDCCDNNGRKRKGFGNDSAQRKINNIVNQPT